MASNSKRHGNASGAYLSYPSSLATMSKSNPVGGAAGSSSHAGSFLQPNVLPSPDFPPPLSPAASTDLEDEAADEVVSQFLNGLYDEVMAEANGSIASSSTLTTGIQVPLLNSFATEQPESTLELEQLPVPPSGGRGSPMSMDRPGAQALFALAVDNMVSVAQMEKIMRDEHLAGLMLTDPKRVKKLIVTRVYAAKRKQDNEKRILDLQRTIQVLEMKRNTLFEELASLQSKCMEILNENSELETKLQSMEKIAQLRGQCEALFSETEARRVIHETIDSHAPNTSHQEMSPNC